MDRELDQQSKDAIKTTILMQERTFKQQVKELHHLYSVQKKLMAELRNETTPSADQIDPANPGSAQTEASGSLPTDIIPLEITSNLGLQTHAIQEFISSGSRSRSELGSGSGAIEDRPGSSMVQPDEEGGKVSEEENTGMDLNLSIGFGSDVATKKST